MKIRANQKNLKLHAKELLGNRWTRHLERGLIKLCTQDSAEDYQQGREHISFAIVAWLTEIDNVLGTYRVESLYPDIDLHYCNAGDSYALTIYHYQGKLWIGDWGSIAEEHIPDEPNEPEVTCPNCGDIIAPDESECARCGDAVM